MPNHDQEKIKALKRQIVQASAIAGEGHIASAFSILDILWVLYDKILKVTPLTCNDDNRDRFILSKGHASLGLYAVLAEKNFFSASNLNDFCRYDSCLGGHPDRNKVNGVEASTGSLGHGFPMAVGIALALKINNINSRTFAIIGDGECNEGTIWESALLAAHHGLANLYGIIDYNHSTDRALSVGDLTHKFTSFGWLTKTIDGHDHQAIYQSLQPDPDLRPKMIIANTVKGQGAKTMADNPAWHHKAPNPEELKTLLGELS